MPFGLWSKKVEGRIDRQKQVDLNYASWQLEQGNLSLVLGEKADKIAGSSSPDESILLSLYDVSLMETGAAQKDDPILHGMTRIAKGLYSYIARQKQAETAKESNEIDRGSLVITTKEIIFVRDELVHIDYGDIQAIEYTDSRITFVINPDYRLHFEGIDKTMIPVQVQDRVYNEPLSGKVLQIILEAVMKVSMQDKGGIELS